MADDKTPPKRKLIVKQPGKDTRVTTITKDSRGGRSSVANKRSAPARKQAPAKKAAK